MPTESKSRPTRYRNYTFLVYPDSAPADWVQRLRDWHIPMQTTNLPHDNDDDEDGDKKKAHFHVLVLFDSPVKTDALDEVIASVNGVKPPANIFVVKNARAYARYLLHYDDPGKYPYYKDSRYRVISLSGAPDYDEFIKSRSERDFEEQQTMQDIQDYLEKHEIFNFAVACELARRTDNQEWFQCLKVNAYYFHSWCKSHNDPSWNAEHSKLQEILEKNYIKEK